MKTWLLSLTALPKALLIGVVRAYRLFLSPWLGSACRFTPSCSLYALDALAERGAAVGTYLTLARLARCHPWCEGGHDPVPTATGATQATQERLFSFCLPAQPVHPSAVDATPVRSPASIPLKTLL